MWPRLVNVALGAWLMAAPAVLGYTTTSALAEASDRIIGPLVISASIAAIWDEIRPLRWVSVFLGGAAVVLPLVLGPFFGWPIDGAISSIVSGALIIVFGRIRGPIDNEFGGGWKSTWRDDIDTIHDDPYGRELEQTQHGLPDS